MEASPQRCSSRGTAAIGRPAASPATSRRGLDLAGLAQHHRVAQHVTWIRRSLARTTPPVTLCEILTGAVPYVCTPDTPLDVVARCMVASNTDVAVVVNEQMNVIGIFTAVDALRCMGGELRMR